MLPDLVSSTNLITISILYVNGEYPLILVTIHPAFGLLMYSTSVYPSGSLDGLLKESSAVYWLGTFTLAVPPGERVREKFSCMSTVSGGEWFPFSVADTVHVPPLGRWKVAVPVEVAVRVVVPSVAVTSAPASTVTTSTPA